MRPVRKVNLHCGGILLLFDVHHLFPHLNGLVEEGALRIGSINDQLTLYATVIFHLLAALVVVRTTDFSQVKRKDAPYLVLGLFMIVILTSSISLSYLHGAPGGGVIITPDGEFELRTSQPVADEN